MKCPDLCRKVIFANTQSLIKVGIGMGVNLQTFLARNRMKGPDLYRKVMIINGNSSWRSGWSQLNSILLGIK